MIAKQLSQATLETLAQFGWAADTEDADRGWRNVSHPHLIIELPGYTRRAILSATRLVFDCRHEGNPATARRVKRIIIDTARPRWVRMLSAWITEACFAMEAMETEKEQREAAQKQYEARRNAALDSVRGDIPRGLFDRLTDTEIDPVSGEIRNIRLLSFMSWERGVHLQPQEQARRIRCVLEVALREGLIVESR